MRDASIHLRVLPEQRDLIDQAASLLKNKRTDYMLKVLCEHAQSVLLDQVFFRLNDLDYKMFTEVLDAPPEHNAGLAHLLEINTQWEKQID